VRRPFARSVGRACLIALLVLLPAAPATAAPSATPETGRYYVVGPPVNGQPDYLYAIAASTLHNGNRYQEIFQLNQGRLQKDGGRLTDPAEVLHPGWVLELPKDARGPRVLTGPLPLPHASSSPVAAPPPAPVTTRPAADGRPLLTYGGLTLAVLLVGFAVVITRRRPAETKPLAMPMSTSSMRADKAKPARPVAPTTATARPEIAAPAVSRAWTAQPGVKSDLAGEAYSGPGMGATGVSALVRVPPARPSAGPVSLSADLVCGGDPASVRLIGGRDGAVAYVWLGPGMHPPGGKPGVVLGRGAEGRLWLDLAAAPDVLTVTGDPAAGLRQARALIDQLYADGTPFTVVGTALEDGVPADLPDVDLATPRVLICAGVAGHELPGLLERVRAAAGRLLPIVVGDVPAARWSLTFPENA
jgi:hypothetical protein